MADIADMASAIEGEHLAASLRRARVPIPAGVAGECEECGDDSPRLVDGRCAPCRDGRNRPVGRIVRPPAEPSDGAREAPPLSTRESAMPAKTIQLPATAERAICAVETYAREHDCPLGAAAAALIDKGMLSDRPAPLATSPAPLALDAIHADALVAELQRRLSSGADRGELDATLSRAEAAEAERDAANRKLAALREALA